MDRAEYIFEMEKEAGFASTGVKMDKAVGIVAKNVKKGWKGLKGGVVATKDKAVSAGGSAKAKTVAGAKSIAAKTKSGYGKAKAKAKGTKAYEDYEAMKAHNKGSRTYQAAAKRQKVRGGVLAAGTAAATAGTATGVHMSKKAAVALENLIEYYTEEA